MENSITFTIEKLFGPDKSLKGYFVTKSNEAPVKSNPMADIMKMAMEHMGEAQAVPPLKIREGYFVLLPKRYMII